MAKKPKMNGELLTQEEWQAPLGLGYTMAADRLGLQYLLGPEPIFSLLVEFANEAWDFSMKAHLPEGPFWKAMNRKADKLATILKGKNPAYMATPWFTDPHQLRAHLRAELQKARPNDPPNAPWRKDPIREYARNFMEFFLDLTEGAVEPQGHTSNQQLVEQHVKRYTGAFMGVAPEFIGGSVIVSGGDKPNTPWPALQNKEERPCG